MEQLGKRARAVVAGLASLATERKNQCLETIADLVIASAQRIRGANHLDLEQAETTQLSEAMIDRLRLTPQRIEAMADGLRQVAALPDPIGEITKTWRRPNGLVVSKMRIPLGVIGIIYESRPNVTIDAAALCFKSGNPVILRGGSEAFHSNMLLVELFREGLGRIGVAEDCVQIVANTDRSSVSEMLQASAYVDLIIPRGGESLIRYVSENARMPVIQHYKGNCHIFVDATADHQRALAITLNAKTQRPGVCNALETLLVHEAHVTDLLPRLLDALSDAGVELRGCDRTRAERPEMAVATEDDWYAEYTALVLAVKVVDNLDQAIAHIRHYGSDHTESIITDSYNNAQRFLREIDSSVVLVNASTRFSDGFQLGLGAEIGISTTRFHAYGPMGLNELTAEKYVIYGEGQIRD